MNIVIATEKPSIARELAPSVRAHWPHDTITFFNVVPYGNILHSYPRGLKVSDFPYIGRPKDKLRAWADWACKPIAMAPDGTLSPLPAASPELLKQADLIVFACDPDHTGVTGFAVLMEQVFGDDRAKDCPAIWLNAIDSDSVRKAVAAMTPFGLVAAPSLEYGRTKRFFDWHWNTNSLAVLGVAMRLVGVPVDAPPLSKYALQLLYALRSRGAMSEGAIVQLMVSWPGTGRYTYASNTPRPRLGSAASYSSILENLRGAGLLTAASRGDRSYDCFQVSPVGQALLRSLHPDCEDPDLPFRLDAWCAAGAASRPAIERYIRTVFGKQSRFAPPKVNMR
jgi:hypothetical protein